MTLWPFRGKTTPQDTSERLTQEIFDLGAKCTAIERQFKDLRLEWEDTFERVHRALQRLNKRHRDQQKREEVEVTDEVSNARSRLHARRAKNG